MSTNHTEAFQKQLDDFNKRMGNGKKENQQKLFQESVKDASSEEVIQFVANMSSEQTREVMARIKARDSVKGYIGNREIFDYCKEFAIVPERANSLKNDYHLLEDFQDFKIDNRECIIMKNDVDKKVLTVSFDDNDEIREIEY
jgi:hypothetical protein